MGILILTFAISALAQGRDQQASRLEDQRGKTEMLFTPHPDMTSERLARIRMHEEEEACRIIGIGKEIILWLQYHDDMLEYANPRDLVEQVTGADPQVSPRRGAERGPRRRLRALAQDRPSHGGQ